MNRRALLIAAGALAVALYTWQAVAAWQAADDVATAQKRSVATLTGSAPQLDNRGGMAVASAATATATLSEDRRGDTGVLLVHNLPMLPPAKIYRLWGIDIIGTVDHAADFNAPYEGADSFAVPVITAQALSTYRHFVVTVEPADGHDPLPSGPVVMTR